MSFAFSWLRWPAHAGPTKLLGSSLALAALLALPACWTIGGTPSEGKKHDNQSNGDGGDSGDETEDETDSGEDQANLLGEACNLLCGQTIACGIHDEDETQECEDWCMDGINCLLGTGLLCGYHQYEFVDCLVGTTCEEVEDFVDGKKIDRCAKQVQTLEGNCPGWRSCITDP